MKHSSCNWLSDPLHRRKQLTEQNLHRNLRSVQHEVYERKLVHCHCKFCHNFLPLLYSLERNDLASKLQGIRPQRSGPRCHSIPPLYQSHFTSSHYGADQDELLSLDWLLVLLLDELLELLVPDELLELELLELLENSDRLLELLVAELLELELCELCELEEL